MLAADAATAIFIEDSKENVSPPKKIKIRHTHGSDERKMPSSALGKTEKDVSYAFVTTLLLYSFIRYSYLTITNFVDATNVQDSFR